MTARNWSSYDDCAGALTTASSIAASKRPTLPEAPTDSIHQIWAVINEGKPNQIELYMQAIIVGSAAADRNMRTPMIR
jgi:hypothetical protein